GVFLVSPPCVPPLLWSGIVAPGAPATAPWAGLQLFTAQGCLFCNGFGNLRSACGAYRYIPAARTNPVPAANHGVSRTPRAAPRAAAAWPVSCRAGVRRPTRPRRYRSVIRRVCAVMVSWRRRDVTGSAVGGLSGSLPSPPLVEGL